MCASVFQVTYTVPHPAKPGKRLKRRTTTYYTELRDAATGKVKRVSLGLDDRAAAQVEANRREREQREIAEGITSPEIIQARRPVADHVNEFVDYLRGKGNTPRHVRLTAQRLRSLASGVPWGRVADISAAPILAHLERRRAAGRRFGVQSSNHAINVAKWFSKWLWRERRLPYDALANLRPLPMAGQKRHERRALTLEELGNLLSVARASKLTIEGLDGPTRAALYTLAAYTGFRASELASLTYDCISDNGLTVTVEAGYSKRRRRDRQPLHPAALEALGPLLGRRHSPSDRIFPGNWAANCQAGVMLKADLAVAGIPYRDARNKVADFHALRVSYVTNLARAGVPLAVAQRLARHSSPVLTANIYTDVVEQELDAATRAIPDPVVCNPHGRPRKKKKRKK